jgi:hypothetical protein
MIITSFSAFSIAWRQAKMKPYTIRADNSFASAARQWVVAICRGTCYIDTDEKCVIGEERRGK